MKSRRFEEKGGRRGGTQLIHIHFRTPIPNEFQKATPYNAARPLTGSCPHRKQPGASSKSAAVAVHTACKRSLYVTYGQQHARLLQVVQGLQRKLKRRLVPRSGGEASTSSCLPSRCDSSPLLSLPTHTVTALASVRPHPMLGPTRAPSAGFLDR